MGFGGLKSGVGGVFSYPDYASLPSPVKDGTVAVTLNNHQIYIYDVDTNIWIPSSGSGSGSENFSYNRIPIGQTVTIPVNQQMIVFQEIVIEGVLINDTQLVIIED